MTEKEFAEFHEFLNETRFDVKTILASKSRFNQIHDKLYTFMKMGFEEERVRKHPLTYSFDGRTIYRMEIRHFIVNMLCWYPMIKLGRVSDLDEKFVLDCSCLNSKQLRRYFDTMIIEPYRDCVDNMEMNMIFEETLYRLGQISLDFNEIMAISINIEMFIDLAERNEEFHDILTTKPKPGMQPVEIENMVHERMHRIIQILSTEDNDIKPIINSGEGIKDKQLAEFAVMGALKPDIVGNTIPVPIDTNYIVGGLNSVSNYFIDKQAGRKAVVANKTLMGNAGYFAAKIMKVTKDTRLDMNVEDCQTSHPIPYYVADAAHLRIIDKSYYTMVLGGKLKCIKPERDTHLIGKTIYLRNPATCGLSHNKVCKTCYGKMHKVNGHRQFGQGGFGSAITANKYQQDTLSTKHLLTTDSMPITFPDEFYDVFGLEANIITINPDKIDDPGRWTIVINEERLVEYDQVEFNSHTTQLMIKDNHTKEKFVIEEANKKEIFLYQDAIKKFTDKGVTLELNVGSLSDELLLGVIIVENNELTKPLKNMQRLLDTKDHFGCSTVDELVNTLATLMIDAKMGALLVHGSMTLRNLIRKKENVFESPNWRSGCVEPDDYVILKITEALVQSPSLTTGLSSQELRKQFSDPSTFQKHGKASTDVYFKKSLV